MSNEGVTESQTLLLRLLPKHLSDNLTSLLSAPPSPQIIKQLAYLAPSTVSISHIGLKGCCARPVPVPEQQQQQHDGTAAAAATLDPTAPPDPNNPTSAPATHTNPPSSPNFKEGERWEFFMPWIVDSSNSTFDPDPTRPTLNTKMSPTRNKIYKLKSYPALLTNLPTILELQKTSTKSTYVKLTEIGQMLLVFGSETSLQTHLTSLTPHLSPNHPSYYPHGVSPPFHSLLRSRYNDSRRFGYPHNFTPQSIQSVEVEILEYLRDANLLSKRKRRNEKGVLNFDSRGVVEEVFEEEVGYEPWMDDYGRSVGGVSFKEGERLEREHPEVWLGGKKDCVDEFL
ncbi:hypothetical protein TrVE_jg6447 [Triparma verrucosa]|uniref:TAFII55 protein conserved region domain-containing protein n=1 Tax=Triparma verrucosa TaxID=1606542 RepID=A0A9W7BTG0_9STRA|nr:hypothetical protein TrVE_jg6447 [Triparma verrucosa]